VPCLIADEIACWTIRTSASPSACRVLQLIVVSQEKNEADDPTVLMAIGRKKEIHVLVKENERGIARSFVVHFILFVVIWVGTKNYCRFVSSESFCFG